MGLVSSPSGADRIAKGGCMGLVGILSRKGRNGIKISGLLTSALHSSLAAVLVAEVFRLLSNPSIFLKLYFRTSYSFSFPD